MYPIATANDMFSYNQKFFGFKLHNLIDETHKILSKELGWKYSPIVPGQFGYDNLAMSIGWALKNAPEEPTQLQLACLIHRGWALNYMYWRDRAPFVGDRRYKKPGKLLGDKRRNDCANMVHKNLGKEEKQQNDIMAKFLLNKIFNKNK